MDKSKTEMILIASASQICKRGQRTSFAVAPEGQTDKAAKGPGQIKRQRHQSQEERVIPAGPAQPPRGRGQPSAGAEAFFP